MNRFTLDIKGQLNNMRLGENRALWPLFEAVVNSIQAIDDSSNGENGEINILAKRENQNQTSLSKNEPLGRFESFSIADNGIGMNTENYNSFNTAYTTLKIKKGCKGIGRFLWLKAFDHVKIESTYCENNAFYCRKFTFSQDGIAPDNNVSEFNGNEQKTIVTLEGFLGKFKMPLPLN